MSLSTEVMLRRAGGPKYTVRIYDLSPEGCKIEFIERPKLDERVWVIFNGLEALEATVCWIEDHVVGLEFQRPIHSAVFEMLVKRITDS